MPTDAMPDQSGHDQSGHDQSDDPSMEATPRREPSREEPPREELPQAPARARTRPSAAPSSYMSTKLRLAVVGALTAAVFALIWFVVSPSDPYAGAAPGAPHSGSVEGEVVVADRHTNGRPRLVVTYPKGAAPSTLDSTDVVSRRFYTPDGVLYRREDRQTGRIERYGDLYPQARDGAIWRYLGGLWRRTPQASQPASLPGGGEGRVSLVEERLFRRDTMIVRQVVTLRDGEQILRTDDYRTGFQMERRGQGVIAPSERLFEYKNGTRRDYAPGDSMRFIPADLRRAVADTLRLQHPNRFEVLTSEVPGGRKVYKRVN